jgi:hypothetical protein
MKICGKDGVELRCCKTGLVMHDTNFHPDSRFQADMFYCPVCKRTMIVRAYNEYFGESIEPDVTLTNDPTQPMLWDSHFVRKMHDQYQLDIV